MTDFKAGGIPTPDYDSEDINYIYQKTEFTDDVFVYGKLYADLGGDVQTFSTAGVERVRITKEGDVAIGTNNPNVTVDASNTSILAVGIVTAREYYGIFKGSIDPAVANDKISEGNSEAEIIDTGTNGHFKVTTEGTEQLRVTGIGSFGLQLRASDPEYWYDQNVPNSGSGGKVKVARWGQFAQNTLQLNMYGENVDLVQLAAINAEQNISIVVGNDNDTSINANTDNGIYIKNNGGGVGIQTNNPTAGLQVNNYFRSQLVPASLSRPLDANWATQSAIVTRGDYAGGIALDDNGNSGYSIFLNGNGNNLHIRASQVGQVPVRKLEINSDSNTDGKIKSFCQVVFYNVSQTVRDTLTAQTGGVIYNTSTNKLQCWNGSSWNNLF